MRRVVFDTNVWISGISFEGEVRRLLRFALEGRVTVVVSLPLLQELDRVLTGKKFGYVPSSAATILYEIQSFAILVYPEKKIDVIKEDPADNRVLECAREGRADLIVSGDNHLLKLKEWQGISILSPKQFLEKLRKD